MRWHHNRGTDTTDPADCTLEQVKLSGPFHAGFAHRVCCMKLCDATRPQIIPIHETTAELFLHVIPKLYRTSQEFVLFEVALTFSVQHGMLS
jgi:hypothetical protein